LRDSWFLSVFLGSVAILLAPHLHVCEYIIIYYIYTHVIIHYFIYDYIWLLDDISSIRCNIRYNLIWLDVISLHHY
jgi:hypothetical protein